MICVDRIKNASIEMYLLNLNNNPKYRSKKVYRKDSSIAL